MLTRVLSADNESGRRTGVETQMLRAEVRNENATQLTAKSDLTHPPAFGSPLTRRPWHWPTPRYLKFSRVE
ncbi:hypothetical protein EVAR_63388_1 [Eumeta japonica]|uniref:Uncharacterized protein n=1 Tax=Eumeta variegata TaxID=151549 RepID=A0A4C1YQ97_EUMVA|nr:hypothetical protein EVAR_63388_1 [Eumeta japonica]